MVAVASTMKGKHWKYGVDYEGVFHGHHTTLDKGKTMARWKLSSALTTSCWCHGRGSTVCVVSQGEHRKLLKWRRCRTDDVAKSNATSSSHPPVDAWITERRAADAVSERGPPGRALLRVYGLHRSAALHERRNQSRPGQAARVSGAVSAIRPKKSGSLRLWCGASITGGPGRLAVGVSSASPRRSMDEFSMPRQPATILSRTR